MPVEDYSITVDLLKQARDLLEWQRMVRSTPDVKRDVLIEAINQHLTDLNVPVR